MVPAPSTDTSDIAAAVAPLLRTGGSPADLRAQLERLGIKDGVRIAIVNSETQSVLTSFGAIPAGLMLRGGMPIVDDGRKTPWQLYVLPTTSPDDMLGAARGSILGLDLEECAAWSRRRAGRCDRARFLHRQTDSRVDRCGAGDE